VDDETIAFDVLSDRVRRRILAALVAEGELSASEIAARIDVVGPTCVSNHLRVLRTSRAVRERRSGRRRLYSLNIDGALREAYVYMHSIFRSSADVAYDPGRPTSGQTQHQMR
jgi:ArsR family transcriptional regulator, arsenate/arsenite/antimonite-responsive transcriptional repressor